MTARILDAARHRWLDAMARCAPPWEIAEAARIFRELAADARRQAAPDEVRRMGKVA